MGRGEARGVPAGAWPIRGRERRGGGSCAGGPRRVKGARPQVAYCPAVPPLSVRVALPRLRARRPGRQSNAATTVARDPGHGRAVPPPRPAQRGKAGLAGRAGADLRGDVGTRDRDRPLDPHAARSPREHEIPWPQPPRGRPPPGEGGGPPVGAAFCRWPPRRGPWLF